MDSPHISTLEASHFASRFGTVKIGAQRRQILLRSRVCDCRRSEVPCRFCLSLLPVSVQERPSPPRLRPGGDGQQGSHSKCNYQTARYFHVAGGRDPQPAADLPWALAWHVQSERSVW